MPGALAACDPCDPSSRLSSTVAKFPRIALFAGLAVFFALFGHLALRYAVAPGVVREVGRDPPELLALAEQFAASMRAPAADSDAGEGPSPASAPAGGATLPEVMGDPFGPRALAAHALPAGTNPLPAHRGLIVVPFRESAHPSSQQGANRFKNLAVLVPYLTRHLASVGKRPGIDFSIVVVEQDQALVFNKGALLNVGYKLAKAWGYDYMVLHDVDQLPESPRNDYSFAPRPTHLCSASEQFAYRPAYHEMVGGVLLAPLSSFEAVNGYSNYYWGWGQEDDDFYFRLSTLKGGFDRLSPRVGRYKTLSHPRATKPTKTPLFKRGTAHLRSPRRAQEMWGDGLSNLRFTATRYERDPRAGPYHKVTVSLDFDYRPVDLNGRQASDPEGFVPTFA